MNEWQAEAMRIVHLILGRSHSPTETLIVGGIALATLVLVMRVTGNAIGIPDFSWVRQVLALAVGVGVLVGAAALIAIKVDPHKLGPVPGRVIFMGGPVLAALILAVPIQGFIMRCKYTQALIGFGISICVAMLVILVANAALESLSTSRQESGKIRDRNRVIEEVSGE